MCTDPNKNSIPADIFFKVLKDDKENTQDRTNKRSCMTLHTTEYSYSKLSRLSAQEKLPRIESKSHQTILKSRDPLFEAKSLTNSRKEKTNILNLLKVIREFTE